MSNPKEKAKEFVKKFIPMTKDWDEENGYLINEGKAIDCALIAVDEMIIQNGELYLNRLDGIYYREKNSYLFEVKQEIEKL